MHVTTKSGRKIILPSPAEDAVINAGIAADSDTFELSDAEFSRLIPMPANVVGRAKVATTIRLDADVLDAFKSSGPDWQVRMNDILKEWLDAHP